MFDVNAGEFIFLLVLGVILFGPERLPDLARKLARVVVYLRGIANTAQESVRKELGPDYADLELADLHPKRFIAKQIANYSDVTSEIESVGQSVSSVSGDVAAAKQGLSVSGGSPHSRSTTSRAPRFDAEAT